MYSDVRPHAAPSPRHLMVIFATYFNRPIDHRGDRVPPTLFAAYRSNHHFKNPTCFCPIGLSSDANMINKETAIYRPTEGPYKNQMLAACASDACLYLGDFFTIDTN